MSIEFRTRVISAVLCLSRIHEEAALSERVDKPNGCSREDRSSVLFVPFVVSKRQGDSNAVDVFDEHGILVCLEFAQMNAACCTGSRWPFIADNAA